ncbi:hypothetical protein ACA910_014572 [Epithemia clementina (nom. ined.)]
MEAGHDETHLYEELKAFLISDRVDVRKKASEAVVQIAHEEEHRQKILEHGDGVLFQSVIRNCSYDHDSTAGGDAAEATVDEGALMIPVNSLHALVYLSSIGTTANLYIDKLLDFNMIPRLLEIVLSNSKTLSSSESKSSEALRSKINFAMALMANLTRTEQGAVDMVGRTLPEEAVSSNSAKAHEKLRVKVTMDLLLDRYRNPAFVQQFPSASEEGDTSFGDNALTVEQLDSLAFDPYQHFAAVLMNTTQTEQGRKFLLQLHYTTTKGEEDGTCNFQRIIPQLKSANPIRRRGTAGTIRNICLDKDSSWWLLNVVKISKDILYPLAGPEELDVSEKQGLHPDLWLEGPDKKRETDQPTRRYLVESILLLCASGRRSREQLRLERTYVILKWADMVEESEEVSDCINECVQYLRRDEEGTEEGSSDALVANAYKRIVESSNLSGTTKKQAEPTEEMDVNYDVVD